MPLQFFTNDFGIKRDSFEDEDINEGTTQDSEQSFLGFSQSGLSRYYEVLVKSNILMIFAQITAGCAILAEGNWRLVAGGQDNPGGIPQEDSVKSTNMTRKVSINGLTTFIP